MSNSFAISQNESATRFVIGRRRRVKNRSLWILCSIGLIFVVAPVAWILIGVTTRAMSNWKWSILWTTSTGIGGGLSNAIVGTGVLMLGVAVMAGVVGIGAGVFLAEIARPNRVTTILRSGSEVLAGMPSIVFGYVGYLILVIQFHWGFSLLPALVVLSLIVVPYIAKSTELALNQVPLAYREGGEALGMSRTHVLRRVVMRSAVPGMATGLIVALAISAGETAPMLFTAGFTNSYPSFALLHHQIGYLTYASYSFYDDPSAVVRQLSSDASFLLVVLVLALILISRLVVRLTQKFAPNRATDAGSLQGKNKAGRRSLHSKRSRVGPAQVGSVQSE